MGNLKRDSMFIVGGILVLYLIANLFEVKELTDFFYFILMIIISVIMLCMHIIMYKRFNEGNDAAYRIAAIMFSFQGMNMIYGLMMTIANLHTPNMYMMMLFECNLLELFCIPLWIIYTGKEINQEKITIYIAACFLTVVAISKAVYYHLGRHVYQVLMAGIAMVLVGSNILGAYMTRDFKWKLSEKGIWYLNAFWVARSIYFMLGIYLSLNINSKEALHIRWILMYIKTVYMYFLGISLYYNCLEQSWNQLVEKIRVTKEKIYSNHQDRETIVNLSHELKTPINVIQSATQILRLDDKLDKSAVIELQHIKKECNEAMKLITYMIDINKLRGGYLKLKFEVCNMIEVMENVVEAFAIEYEDAHLIFNTNEEEVKLKIDVTLIQRASMYIIGSLLNNGRHDIYMDLEYVAINKALSVRIYAKDIEQFLREHQQDVAKCKTEEVGDLFALEFIKRILALHQARISHEGSGCLKITLFGVIVSEEEPIYLEDNIEYLRDQIKSCYYYV